MSDADLPAVLLLPPPPHHASPRELLRAYRLTIHNTFSGLKEERHNFLIIAIPCLILNRSGSSQSCIRWSKAQRLLAGVYAIATHVSAELDLKTHLSAGSESLDFRIVLVDYDESRTDQQDDDDVRFDEENAIILTLQTFAASSARCHSVWHVSDTSAGRSILEQILLSMPKSNGTGDLPRIVEVKSTEGDPAPSLVLNSPDEEVSESIKGYNTVILGGTFDHLHPGHKLLLQATALLLKVPLRGAKDGSHATLIIGISGDAMLANKKHADKLEPWSVRVESAISFLSTILDVSTAFASPKSRSGIASITETGIRTVTTPDSPPTQEKQMSLHNGRILIRCVEIHDAFGPTTREEDIDAICVSGESRNGGKAVNDKRREKGWKDLDVYEVDVLSALPPEDGSAGGNKNNTNDFANKLSSTAIRKALSESGD